MRNILVLPDGREIHFRYPEDHVIEEGYPFRLQTMDDQILTKLVVKIERHDTAPEIRYFIED